MSGPSSHTGGVKPMSIVGRLDRERERLRGMTNEERQWRAQYVKDQILAHNEPRYVQEYVDGRFNFIRRIYRKPLDLLGKALVPIVGLERAEYTRYMTGKFLMIIFCIYGTHYYLKYNAHDWTRRGGWHVMVNKPQSLPGDADFPKPRDKIKPQDFGDRGFNNSPI